MMVIPIVSYGSSVLRQIAEEIVIGDKSIEHILENLFDTLNDTGGVGLSAPQIGKSVRAFIIDTTHPNVTGPENFKKVFINPIIYEKSESIQYSNEACLSIPGIREEVKRCSWIRVKYYDENFTLIDEKIEGFVSLVVQHEYDHLNGVLFTDLLAPITKRMIQSRLKTIVRGQVKGKFNRKMKFPNGKIKYI